MSKPKDRFDPDLRDIWKKLGDVVGEYIAERKSDVFEAIERLRRLATNSRRKGAASLQPIIEAVRDHSISELIEIARNYATFLRLGNIASEAYERTKRVSLIREVVKELRTVLSVENDPVQRQEILEKVLGCMVTLVLTRHPTDTVPEVLSRTLGRISQLIQSAGSSQQLLLEVEIAMTSRQREGSTRKIKVDDEIRANREFLRNAILANLLKIL